MTQPINKIPSESRVSEAKSSTSTVSKISSQDQSRDFKFTELFESFRECNEKYKDDDVKQSHCALIARYSREDNSKSFQTCEWTDRILEDAGHGRYNGK